MYVLGPSAIAAVHQIVKINKSDHILSDLQLLVEKYLSLSDENQLCQLTADEQTTVDSISQCISICLEMGDSCMKLTVIKGSGQCLISSNTTTQLCTLSDSHTFIVRPELIPQMPIKRTISIPALIGAPGVNIAAGNISV